MYDVSTICKRKMELHLLFKFSDYRQKSSGMAIHSFDDDMLMGQVVRILHSTYYSHNLKNFVDQFMNEYVCDCFNDLNDFLNCTVKDFYEMFYNDDYKFKVTHLDQNVKGVIINIEWSVQIMSKIEQRDYQWLRVYHGKHTLENYTQRPCMIIKKDGKVVVRDHLIYENDMQFEFYLYIQSQLESKEQKENLRIKMSNEFITLDTLKEMTIDGHHYELEITDKWKVFKQVK